MAEAAAAPSQFEPATPDELNAMAQTGQFSDDEIHDLRAKSIQTMVDNGFPKEDALKFYGALEPDMTPVKQIIKQNLAKHEEENKGPDGKVKPAKDLVEALEAGLQISTAGLAIHGKPTMGLPEDASRFARIANQIGMLAGDLPAMLAGQYAGSLVGGYAGGTIGTAVEPGAGTATGIAIGQQVGGSAGAFALPAALRKALMDHYEKGDIKDFPEFWDRTSAVFLEGLKGAATGAATGTAGYFAGNALKGAGSLVRGTGQVAAEVGTMVSVGKAIEGQMPNADDFIDGIIMVGGLHAVAKVGKFRYVYERTGIPPERIAEVAQTDPVMKQEVLSDNVKLPASLEPLADPEVTEPTTPKKQGDIQRTDAEKKILSQIGEKEPLAKDGYSVSKAYTDFVDKLNPLKEAEKAAGDKNLSAEESPYKQARLAVDYKSKALHAIEKGTLDYNDLSKVTGKGLNQILEPHLDDLDGFRAYLAADRALEVENSGRKSGFDPEAAKQVVQDGKTKYGQAAKELVDFQKQNLKYLKDSGRISQESFDRMTAKGEKYIPFNRILDDVEAGGSGSGAGFLKELKGGEEKIQDPFLSIAKNTERVFRIAEKNRAQRSAVEYDESRGGELFTKVEDAAGRSLRKNEFEIYRDGKREVFSGDQYTVNAVKSLEGNQASQNVFLSLARAMTGIKRIGITLTPDFILKNAFRDQLTGSTFSNTSKNPFSSAAEALVAMGDLMKKNDEYYAWLRSGGGNASFLEINDKYIKQNVFKLDEETGFIKQGMNVITKPFELLHAAGNIIESAPRLAEFKRTMKATGSPMEAGFASREVTVDFQRIGAKMAALNAITAFQNVAIQGLDRTARAIKENPKEVGAKVAAYIVTPSVLLWYANHDDPRYKEIPQWEKDVYWHVITDKWEKAQDLDEASGLPDHLVRQGPNGLEINRGIVYRIPKPQELGMVGSIVERSLDKFVADNPTAGKGLAESISKLLIPSLIPDAITPVAEHATGQNFFTGRPIVPTYLEGQLPYARYTEYTTESSKALGKLLGAVPVVQEQYGASPMVIENYVRGWTGTLGMYALQLADAGLIKSGMVEDPVKPAWSVADIPAVKSFITRYPSAQSQSIQDFYDKFNETKMVLTTLKDKLKKGESGDVDFIMSEYNDKMQNLQGYADALSKQSSFIHAVQRQKDWTPEEKRQLIEQTYYQMIEIGKQGLDVSREMENALKNK